MYSQAQVLFFVPIFFGMNIKLNNNKKLILDKDFYLKYKDLNWQLLSAPSNRFYAYVNKRFSDIKCITRTRRQRYKKKDGTISIYKYKTHITFAHWLVLQVGVNQKNIVDHINGSGLDNRRINLRLCNMRQNQGNRKLNKNNTTGYKGVFYSDQAGKYRVELHTTTNGKRYRRYGGLHNNLKDAALAYNKLATEYFGKYARLNTV